MTTEVQELQLSVVDPNKRAITLYESLGFKKVSNFTNGNKTCVWHTMVRDADMDLDEVANSWTQMNEGIGDAADSRAQNAVPKSMSVGDQGSGFVTSTRSALYGNASLPPPAKRRRMQLSKATDASNGFVCDDGDALANVIAKKKETLKKAIKNCLFLVFFKS